MRELDTSGSAPRGMVPARLWVYTAAIDLGAQRVRVLVSPLDLKQAMGPRIVGRGRIAAAAGVLSAAALAAVAVALIPALGRSHHDTPAQAGAATAPVAVAMAASATATSPTAAASPVTPTVNALPASHEVPAGPPAPVPTASAVAHPPAQARAAADPVDEGQVLPVRQAPAMRHIVPFLNDAARQAAREASEAARTQLAAQRRGTRAGDAGATAAAAAAPAVTAAVKPAQAPPAGTPVAMAPRPPPATAWAVSTRNLRTRFESEQMLAALRDAAYRSGHGKDLKVEVLPSGDDWRAVGWPFSNRAEAERLREALAARGLKAEVVQF
jgi:hypothetical protein